MVADVPAVVKKVLHDREYLIWYCKFTCFRLQATNMERDKIIRRRDNLFRKKIVVRFYVVQIANRTADLEQQLATVAIT
jgi:hypothetical protein